MKEEKIDDVFIEEFIRSNETVVAILNGQKQIKLGAIVSEAKSLYDVLGPSSQMTIGNTGTPKIGRGGFTFKPDLHPVKSKDQDRLLNTDKKPTFQQFQRQDLDTILEHYKTKPDPKHGRLHIVRSEILAKAMANFYLEAGEKVDLVAVQFAVALHDNARSGGGPDIWEHESARNAFYYLKELGYDDQYAKYVASMIVKNDRHQPDLTEKIVHDADTLEILRVLKNKAKDPRDEFRRDQLNFLKPETDTIPGEDQETVRNRIREQLIKDALDLIDLTETDPKVRGNLEFEKSENYLQAVEGLLIEEIMRDSSKFPFLKTFYFHNQIKPASPELKRLEPEQRLALIRNKVAAHERSPQDTVQAQNGLLS